MARHIPPGYAAFSIEHWLANYTRPAVTTFAAKILGTDGVGGTIADAFHYAFTDAFRGGLDTSVTIRNARAVVGQDGTEPLVFDSTLISTGAQTRESVAPALALMLDKRTGIGGRRNRGRMYIPWGVAEGQVSETGAIAGASITSWSEACGDFLRNTSGVGESELTELFDFPVLLHSEPLITPTPITTMSPNPVVRTQKQRQARF